MRSLLEEKYGLPLFSTKIYDKYRKEGYFELFIWFSGNKEIQLRQFMNICKITYTDLNIVVQEEDNDRERRVNEIQDRIQMDSIENVNKRKQEIEDSISENKSIKTF